MEDEELLGEEYNHWFSLKNNLEPPLPEDPRYWTRNEVALWLKYMENEYHIPTIQLDRFCMNGKALCLMNKSMFLDRVPFGGKLLHKDFQLRLVKAIYNIEIYQT